VKFLIYNLAGGLLMLASIIGLYFLSSRDGSASFLISDLTGIEIGAGTEKLLFIGFMAAFAIKAPLFPFHTWLPDAAASATPSTAVLMVSVIDKVGTFGMLRWGLGLFPGAAEWATPVVVTLAVISVVYGALLAIGQDDLRRLIAFTSVSHFGFIILGLFAVTSTSTAGATFYMFNHGLSTAALFLIAGILIARHGSASIADFGGVQKVAPVLTGLFLIAGLSSLSLPGLAPFISEFMVMAGTYTRYPVAAVVSVIAIVLSAIYILVMFQRTMTGPLREDNAHIRDLNPLEMASLAPAIVLMVGLGFFPQPMLNVINPAVDATLSHIGAGDPPPETPQFPQAQHGEEGGH
jgi:NADH-quinone oxidoreductase subunit M